MKKAMPIDLLLQWTYGLELMKNPYLLPAGTLKTVYGSFLKFGRYGCIIDNESSGGEWPWLPEIEGPPHVDALRVDAAVQALEPILIDWESSTDFLGCYGLMAQHHLFIYNNEFKVSPKGLVTSYAGMRRSPHWGEDMPQPKKIMNGSSIMIVGSRQGRRSYPDGSHCPLTYEPSPSSVARERADYAAWHHAIMQLQNDLVDKLEAHIPTMPLAPACPWEGERARKPRVLMESCSTARCAETCDAA